MAVIKEIIILSVVALIAYSYCDPIQRDFRAYLNSEDEYKTSKGKNVATRLEDVPAFIQQEAEKIMHRITDLKQDEEDSSISDNSDQRIEQEFRFLPRFLWAGFFDSSSDEDKTYVPASRRRRHWWTLGKK